LVQWRRAELVDNHIEPAGSWPITWDASTAPDGAAAAVPANPNAAVAIAPAATAGKVKDFIGLPFEEAFLTGVPMPFIRHSRLFGWLPHSIRAGPLGHQGA
jgi:hypothetical protein